MLTGITQRITERDIAGGRVRVPHETKRFFPDERARVQLVFLGTPIECRWDPRYGPDQERSGILGVGRELLKDLARPDERLTVRQDGGIVHLERPASHDATASQ